MKKGIYCTASILVGNLLVAFAISTLMLDHSIVVGGVSGLGVVAQNYLHIPVSLGAAVANGALFLAGWLVLGRAFALTTLASTFVFPLFLRLFERCSGLNGWMPDPLAASVIAGCLIGLGIGLVIRAGASTGGVDILALILNLTCNHDIHIQPKHIRWNKQVVREIYRVGFPSIVMQSISSVMVFGMNKILFGFTKTATAVFGSYFKLQSFVFMPVFGLNNGMVPIVSYNYGAARPDRVKKTVKLAVCAAVGIMAIGFAVFQLFPQTLLSFFNASDEMMEIGSVALRIISFSFLFAGFCVIAGSVCQAIGNPIHSLIISVGRQLVVLLPVAWLLSLTGRLELVWVAFPVAELVSLILSIVFLRHTLHKVEQEIGTAKP